ncbi:MAG: hypothetical protein JWQ78_805 [Sediminibacterium sp.]|nr:hypothetical protein [Sediminibacterium sp.]
MIVTDPVIDKKIDGEVNGSVLRYIFSAQEYFYFITWASISKSQKPS